MNRSFRFLVFCLFAFGVLSGCASKSDERFFWPPPPNEPKFEWLSLIHSESDLPKNQMGRFVGRAISDGSSHVFERPIDVASDGEGLVYVSDNTANMVHLLDLTKGTIGAVGDAGSVRQPLGLAIDAQRRLYIVDAGRHMVLVYSHEHKPLLSFGGMDRLEKPAFLAVSDSLDRVYVTDAKGSKVVVFDKQGKFLFEFGQSGSGEGEFFSPQGIAVNAEGKVFVVDMFNFRVQVFSAEGVFISDFGEQGIHQSQFELPKDIAIDSDGYIHVTDPRKSALLSFREDGRFLMSTGMGRSAHAMGFTMPSGIAIDKNDQVFITDNLLRRISHWQYLSEDYLTRQPLDPELLKQREQKMEEILRKKGAL